MEKHEQAQREANAAATASENMYPAPPSYEQATCSSNVAHIGFVPPPEAAAVSAPKPTSMPMPMPMPTHTSTPTQVYVSHQTRGYPTQGPPIVHVQTQNQQPVVIIQQHAQPLGPESTFAKCHYCQADMMTNVVHEPNSRTHLMALLLCLLGFWCCACVPYCATSCMSANHYCKNCNRYLGAYSGAL